MSNPFDMLSRSAQRLPLLPQERAFLAFLWQFLLTTLLNAVGAFAYGVGLYLINGGNLTRYQWVPVLALQVITTLHSIATGVRKYITAHADMQYTPVGVVASDVATDLSAPNPFSPQAVAQLGESLLQHIAPRLLSSVSAMLSQQAQQQPAQAASVAHPQAQPAVSTPVTQAIPPAPAPVSVGVNTAQVNAVTGGNWMNS